MPSSPPKTTAAHANASPKPITENTDFSSNDLTSSMSTISQDAMPDCIGPSELRSDAYAFLLSEDPSEVAEEQERPQLQQWVYETRNPVITVAERLEKLSWERCEITDVE
jgi:hypothetical protein